MIKEQKSIVLSPNCAASHYSVCIRRSSDHLSKLAENNSNGKQWLLVIACESFQGTLFWLLTNFILIFHLKMTNECCAVLCFYLSIFAGVTYGTILTRPNVSLELTS